MNSHRLGMGCLAVASLCILFFATSAQDRLAPNSPSGPSEAQVVRTYIELLESSGGKAFESRGLALSGDIRVGVSKFHLALELAGNSTLNEVQRSFLMDSLREGGLFDPNLVGTNPSADNATRLAALGKYVEVVSLDTESDRKEAFRALSTDDKKSVWRTRLAVHLTLEPLDKTKQQLVAELLTIIGSEPVYSGKDSASVRAKYDDFEKRAREQFGRADTFRLFMSLGKAAGCEVSKQPSAPQDLAPNCNCYYDSYCEIQNDWAQCRTGSCNRVSGCGIIFDTTCEGRCRT